MTRLGVLLGLLLTVVARADCKVKSVGLEPLLEPLVNDSCVLFPLGVVCKHRHDGLASADPLFDTFEFSAGPHWIVSPSDMHVAPDVYSADLDGDGTPDDLVVAEDAWQSTGTILNEGLIYRDRGRPLYLRGIDNFSPDQIADVNGDGRCDLLTTEWIEPDESLGAPWGGKMVLVGRWFDVTRDGLVPVPGAPIRVRTRIAGREIWNERTVRASLEASGTTPSLDPALWKADRFTSGTITAVQSTADSAARSLIITADDGSQSVWTMDSGVEESSNGLCRFVDGPSVYPPGYFPPDPVLLQRKASVSHSIACRNVLSLSSQSSP